MSEPVKVNLLNLNYAKMRDYFVAIGEKPFRAQQIMQWLHQAGHQNFDEVSESTTFELAHHNGTKE